MTNVQLLERVRQLRAEGRSPKEIARTLGLAPAMVSPLIRQIAREATMQAPLSSVVGCWVSPGWSIGLRVEGFADWPTTAPEDCEPGHGGIAGALVARRHRPGRVSVCGYLVDTWCLGVKNALGPRLMNERRLPEFRERFFAAFDADPVRQPAHHPQPTKLRCAFTGATPPASSRPRTSHGPTLFRRHPPSPVVRNGK